MSEPAPLLPKDVVLDRLAARANVAQFVSFAPGDSRETRFCRLLDEPPNRRFATEREAVAALAARSAGGRLNVRSFSEATADAKRLPFDYGLSSIEAALSTVAARRAQGLGVIVNETVDVDDGGFSGVALGGICEFAPGDTPRCVERPGTTSMSREMTLRLCETVYGFRPDLSPSSGERVEFSVHPARRGWRRTHTLLWEVDGAGFAASEPRLTWPNRFSRTIGDKAFGLLVAHLVGLPVPCTRVIPRRLAPFRFGEATGTAEIWTRTCPVVPDPGRFYTGPGWTDPFRLMHDEDPSGRAIASVLAQDGVDPAWSGASVAGADGSVRIEGTVGPGLEFMAGRAAPSRLPESVRADVVALQDTASVRLSAPVRLEWVHDGERAWIVQLHVGAHAATGSTIYPGEPARFRRFDPALGIDALRAWVDEVDPAIEGIEIVGDVGVTSHLGDLLRRAKIPSRLHRDA